jgi:hypothetical protein
MQQEINLLSKLPRGKRNINARAEAKTDEIITISRQYDASSRFVKSNDSRPGAPSSRSTPILPLSKSVVRGMGAHRQVP